MLRRTLIPITLAMIVGSACVIAQDAPGSNYFYRNDDENVEWFSRAESAPRPGVVSKPTRNSDMRLRKTATIQLHESFEPISEEEAQRRKEWHELRDKIRQTEDPREREDLGKDLKSVLEQIFDKDLAKRDENLAKLEERVQTLRDAIDRRRANRDRIITVQLDSVMLNAEGLTFPGANTFHWKESSQWRKWPQSDATYSFKTRPHPVVGPPAVAKPAAPEPTIAPSPRRR